MALTWRQSWPVVYTQGTGGTHSEQHYVPEAPPGADGASGMTRASVAALNCCSDFRAFHRAFNTVLGCLCVQMGSPQQRGQTIFASGLHLPDPLQPISIASWLPSSFSVLGLSHRWYLFPGFLSLPQISNGLPIIIRSCPTAGLSMDISVPCQQTVFSRGPRTHTAVHKHLTYKLPLLTWKTMASMGFAPQISLSQGHFFSFPAGSPVVGSQSPQALQVKSETSTAHMWRAGRDQGKRQATPDGRW